MLISQQMAGTQHVLMSLGAETSLCDLKCYMAVHRKPISELQSVTRRMGLHSVTCHPTQLNAPRLDKNKVVCYSRLFICLFFVVHFAQFFRILWYQLLLFI